MTAFLLLSLALSLDNFTIALAVGAQDGKPASRALLPIVFGAFAFVTPAIGWLAGSSLAPVLHKYGGLAACAILVYVGLRTLLTAWSSVNDGYDASSLSSIFALGLATSVDSFTVGFALALTHATILALALTNGLVCLGLSALGLSLAQRIGRRFPKGSRVVAGLMLIAVGIRSVITARPW